MCTRELADARQVRLRAFNGRKRYLLVDTMGLVIAAIGHRADIQDRDGAPLCCPPCAVRFPRCATSLLMAAMLATSSAKHSPDRADGHSTSSKKLTGTSTPLLNGGTVRRLSFVRNSACIFYLSHTGKDRCGRSWDGASVARGWSGLHASVRSFSAARLPVESPRRPRQADHRCRALVRRPHPCRHR